MPPLARKGLAHQARLRIWILSKQDAAEKLEMFLVQAIPGHDLVPCVYVKTVYTMTVVAGRGQLSIFDSHSHGTKGALIAISGSTASPRDLVQYVTEFFLRHFASTRPDADFSVMICYQ